MNRRAPSLIKIERLLAELAQRTMTIAEAAEFLHVEHNTARCYLRDLHAEQKVHIKRWQVSAVAGRRNYPRQCYAAGPGKDAPRPAKKTPYQRRRDWFERVKKDPAAYTAYLIRSSHRKARHAFKPHADVAAQWLFRGAA